MSEQSESPFFPVPVRWFEIPMNTARWGFMRPSEVAEATAEMPADQRVESPPAASSEPDPAPKSHVGTLLNARA
jgi:hypothetical protein